MSKKKPNKPPQLPTPRDLVQVGPRHVQLSHHGKRNENGLKPSTSRALILRNGKYGARGTGEVILAGRITGREKLDLLAEELVLQKSRTALMAPFKLGKCIRIADSQYNAYLDDIADLKDPDMFFDRIMAELRARSPPGVQDMQQSLQNASYVASVISTRIHNTYMVASAWKFVVDTLHDLQNSGLNDATARAQLQGDDNLRSRYLVLCDIVGVLVDLGQACFSILAMTAPHYSRYFKEVENAQPGEPSVAFDWASLKDACKSFLDSIIIELCFPKAPYPKRILYHILHDAVDESPREAKRFPQSMWDAIGDLSVSLELQELLENPFLGSRGEELRILPRQIPKQYERWLDAQVYSKQASESYTNFKDLINPLERTKDPSVLDNMWKFINLNYKSASGSPIDSLWQLDGALRRTPQWSSFYAPNLGTYDSDSDGEQSSMVFVKSGGQKRAGMKKRKKPLAITDGRADDDGNSSMPGLETVSDSSGEDDEDIHVSENDEEESDYNDESDYDSEEDEVYRTMEREAMDAAMAIPEFFDPKSTFPEFDALTKERKGNPFLKLLGSLRGRMFSSDPKLSSTTRAEPRKSPFRKKGRPAQALCKQAPVSTLSSETSNVPGSKAPPTQPAPSKERRPVRIPEEPQDYRGTVEDVEDEDEDVSSIASKKKKRKPKKKKKKAISELHTVHENPAPGASTPPRTLPSSTLAETPTKAPSNPPASNASLNSLAQMSTSSLPIESTVAQSAHSYLRERGAPKEKVKSRPDHASVFPEKKSFLSKLSSKDKVENENDSDPTINKESTWLAKLRKKTAGYMQQLLGASADEKVGPLKWDNFLKVMREMGFKYDPSTAGSSVRFDPPNPKDRSITFHKRALSPVPLINSSVYRNLKSTAHPESTIHPIRVKEYGARLKRYYGWSEEDFLRRVSTI